MPSKPLLIYDGDCYFCRRWIERWRRLTGTHVEYAPYQEAAARFPQISLERFKASVQLIDEEGRIFSGAEAVFRTLSFHSGCRWLLRCYQKMPGFAALAEWSYQFVARHRTAFSVITRWLWGETLQSNYFLARWLFLRLLGLIYLVAFISLGFQIEGLVGSQGIWPAQDYLRAVRQSAPAIRYWMLPTLAWLNASDAFLKFLCWGGAFFSGLLIVGVAQAPILFVLWMFYLSLSSVCHVFLSFQWDILLLEAGFLAIFLAPAKFLPNFSQESSPSRLILFLMRYLLFKLMFLSGCVKLFSGDSAWHDLTALHFHYETQPLPTVIGWYAHQLPQAFHKMSAAVMFAIELGAPFLIFFPRRIKAWTFFLFVGFQFLIMLTGNYCFFNWLTIALCLFLLDDAMLAKFFPSVIPAQGCHPVLGYGAGIQAPNKESGVWTPARYFFAAFVCAVFFASSMEITRTLSRPKGLPIIFEEALSWVTPFRTINSYGLFAVMTTKRPEIIIEGSQDGRSWLEYEFKWKPGDPKKPPRWVAPHQPRLDWQMWFAALGSYQQNPWFMNFLVRLLQGSKPVLALLKENPFPNAPPRYLRAVVYEYHFTDWATKRKTGAWWSRGEPRGLYCSVLSLTGS